MDTDHTRLDAQFFFGFADDGLLRCLAGVNPAADAGPEPVRIAHEQDAAVPDRYAGHGHHHAMLAEAVRVPRRQRCVQIGHLKDVFSAGDFAGDAIVDANGRRQRASKGLEGGLGPVMVVAAGQLADVDVQAPLLRERR